MKDELKKVFLWERKIEKIYGEFKYSTRGRPAFITD